MWLEARRYGGKEMMNVDVELLRQQYDFLVNYPWHEKREPEQVTGVLNLIEAILEKEG